MKVNEIGEFDLINRLVSKVKVEQKSVLGIGDDCSVRLFNKDNYQLTTTDLLIEGIHFIRNKITAYELGNKSIQVAISDIAAMGGVPESIHLALGIPKDCTVEYLDQFFMGINKCCSINNIELLGGDTSQSPKHLMINVVAQGFVNRNRIKLRSSAKSGDFICLSGSLGDSEVGLRAILGEIEIKKETSYFIDRHNNPKSELEKAKFLSEFNAVHAMIDISDGLASDIRHICSCSNLGAIINLDAIPVSPKFKEFFLNNQNLGFETALQSGEEYRLLFTVSPIEIEKLSKAYKNEFNEDLISVGQMTENKQVGFRLYGQLLDRSFSGFRHFEGAL